MQDAREGPPYVKCSKIYWIHPSPLPPCSPPPSLKISAASSSKTFLQEMENSDEVCRSFRNNNKCRYGDDCKVQIYVLCSRQEMFFSSSPTLHFPYTQFVHSEGEPIQPPPRSGGRECFEFRDNGECSHGDRCRFSHGSDDARFTGEISDEVCTS